MRYFKFIPIAGIFDEKTRRRITNAMHGMKLNVGSEFGRKGCLNWFKIVKIEKDADGRIFTLKDRRGAPYVFKIKNGYLVERILAGELSDKKTE